MPDERNQRPTAEQAFEEAFAGPRDPRSAEYKAGCLAVLRCRLDGVPIRGIPYPVGSVHADAWFSGNREGHSIFRRLEDDERKRERAA